MRHACCRANLLTGVMNFLGALKVLPLLARLCPGPEGCCALRLRPAALALSWPALPPGCCCKGVAGSGALLFSAAALRPS